ncbi:MAG: tetratricopeptide repeat protein [Gammaproteobacteria bacterium]|jgi:hypothetical protein
MLPTLVLGGIRPHQELRDVFYGEILYHAYQEDFFEAISHLDNELGQYYALDEPELDSFNFHRDQAEFSVGDIELSYRMHLRAGRALNRVLDENVDPAERNDAAYRLARLYYRRQEYVNALHAIELVRGDMPEKIANDETFLRAQIYVATGKFSDAIQLLKSLRGDEEYEGYTEYNLGMAYLLSGQQEQGLAMLDQLGEISSADEAVLALKDKGNLKLAYTYLDAGLPDKARIYFDRVRLDGPFSNRALLGAGWVEVSEKRFDRALVPWTVLHGRLQTNASVQEAMMAVPYAYSKLDVHGKAAIMYGQALDVFGNEIDNLDASIKSIREGKFLLALIDKNAEKDKNWVVNLRDLPESPETRYIMELLASHDFQESLKNYKDLADLREYLSVWLDNLETFEEIIAIRKAYYEPLLPEVEKEFKKLDSRIKLRVEQRARLNDRIQSLLVSRRPEYLATANERSVIDRLARIKVDLEANPETVNEEISYRLQRLDGLMQWQINQAYDSRLTSAYEHLQELEDEIDEMNKRYRSFVRTRQAATQSYEGYTIPIQQLRTRIKTAQINLRGIMARQGRMLETLAINELDRRRKRLEEYQVKARFALAESYDRATKAQEQKEIEALQEQAKATLKNAEPVKESNVHAEQDITPGEAQ